MPIVQTAGQLRASREIPDLVTPPSGASSPLNYGTPSFHTYARIYATQPNVRTCIDFLARNMAQLNLHVFRRVSDTDRERLSDHPLAQLIAAPNPGTCRYKQFEMLMLDLGIYYTGYWLKLRNQGRLWLVRLPPEDVTPDGWLLPKAFYWQPANQGDAITLAPEDVVYITGYDPCNPLQGLSPLETLRRTLAEETAASTYRESFWTNAARLEGVIHRPAGASKWTPEQKQAFREQWHTRFAGHPGQTAVLDEGMTFQAISQTAKDSEYVAARKLTREECAAAYHIPLPMVGILEHATFSNVKEQHKQLYQDTLGPWCAWLQEEIERQVLVEFADTKGIYTEFNIAEKLKGSFEEQALSLQALVGRPIMTPNEGRARLNLPAMTNDPTADQLARPLNQTTGSGTPSLPPPEALEPLVRRAWMRQRAALEKVPVTDRAAAFDRRRWDRELAEDLRPVFEAHGVPDAPREAWVMATAINRDTVARLMQGAVEAFEALEAT